MNEEYVVGLLRVSLAEYLKDVKCGLGRAFAQGNDENVIALIKDIQVAEELLRAPDMETVRRVVKALK